MKIKNQVPLKRLIGKIDNDFNISESDWIPRVAAWVIDALSQMQCLPMERKRRTLEVSDKIANFPCTLNSKEIKVFDKNGCEIKHIDFIKNGCCSGSGNIPNSEIGVYKHNSKNGADTLDIVTITASNRYFILDGNNIELSFNTDCIVVESYEVATYYDDYFNCEVPYIYDNGILLEALSWYVLYKYLSRGSKHPVYSLTTPNQVLNPFIQWNTLRLKAMTSVKNSLNEGKDDGWKNFFYNSTFDPRR